uniref:Protein kinase domain-containing protein n=2 Tax=Kalanchoe fedtschenkoi TaxID=63787 RepID=A0A7N0U7H8_KALFE
MAANSRLLVALLHFLIWLTTLNIRLGNGTVTDVYCLKTMKESIRDPEGHLSRWDFSNNSEGSICKFNGVSCWHDDENRVLTIKLGGLGLIGQFPSGLENCSSLTGLDLANNYFAGPIPAKISQMLPFVTVLDLSSNNFSGEIPESLANCTYLNVLRLNDNELTGQIPPQLGLLNRLKEFSVANNNLQGQVPTFVNATFSADSYASNPGLCGAPLDACRGSSKINTGIIAGTTIGMIALTAIVIGVIFGYCSPRARKAKKDDDPEGNKWAKSIKGVKGVKVSMFEKSVTKVSLKDLMKATNSFSKNNIIGSGRTGTMYKAVVSENHFLMIKRLQDTQRSEKEFMAEMNTLGTVRHRNLVPLLGYCAAKKERFLIYKYIPNGTLYDNLHPGENEPSRLDWQMRLKIAIGAARGLSWLHHSCNPRIIHRNISSKCILLDKDFEPQLADFGLARLMNPLDTHLSTFVNGEFGDIGYVAPEYPRTLVVTPKGDVFSLGTVLLELVTGELPTGISNPPEDFRGSLVEWVQHLSKNSKLHTAVDRSLIGKGYDDELHQFIRVACNCVSQTPKDRPTMFEVYQLLRAIGEKYNFSAFDDISIPIDTDNAVHADEYIVALETITE